MWRQRRRGLADAVKRLGGRKVEVVWLEGQTWRALQTAMQGGPWHIVHYVGHARVNAESGTGELLLADEKGAAAPLGAEEFGSLLEDHQALRLVILERLRGRAATTRVVPSPALRRRSYAAACLRSWQCSTKSLRWRQASSRTRSTVRCPKVCPWTRPWPRRGRPCAWPYPVRSSGPRRFSSCAHRMACSLRRSLHGRVFGAW